MNPTIEVQITAKLDKLDAALKVAEAKIGTSAVTMGNTGDQGGSMFVDRLVGGMVKGLAMGAISNVLGGGILTALQGINAGKAGDQIGIDIASGIVKGAKSIPVVGEIVAIFDELVNGFDRIVDAQFKSMLAKTQAFTDSISAKMTATVAAAQSIENKIKMMGVKDDPKKLAEVNKQIQIQAADDRLQAIQDEKQAEIIKYREVQNAKKESIDLEEANVSMTGAGLRELGVEGITSFEGSADEAKAEVDRATERGIRALNTTNVEEKKIAELKIAIAKDTADQIAKIDKEAADKAAAYENALYEKKLASATNTGDFQVAQKLINDKAAADQKALNKKNATTAMSEIDLANATKEINNKAAEDQKALDKKTAMSAMEMGNQMVADFKEQEQEKYDAAMKAQQDIIDANTAAQAQISKVGRLDKMANEAAGSMIQSGQTALGQFNFAQQGAGMNAMDLAKKQVESLEKIEVATAEQVRLTRENKGFQ